MLNVVKTMIIIHVLHDQLANVVGTLRLEAPANKAAWVRRLSTLRQLRKLGDGSMKKFPDFWNEEAKPHLQKPIALSYAQIDFLFARTDENREEGETSQTKNEISGTGSICSRCKDGRRGPAHQSGSEAVRVFRSSAQQDSPKRRRERFLTASAVAVFHMSNSLPGSLWKQFPRALH
ncbi:hypothetical protein AB1P65_06275 [Roseibium alexandrii]